MTKTLPKTLAAIILTFKLILNLNDNWELYKKNNKYRIREVEPVDYIFTRITFDGFCVDFFYLTIKFS